MISPSQRPLPGNTQHSQHTHIYAPGGIRTHNLSRRAAVDLRLRPRGYSDRQTLYIPYILISVVRFNPLLCLGQNHLLTPTNVMIASTSRPEEQSYCCSPCSEELTSNLLSRVRLWLTPCANSQVTSADSILQF